MIILTCPIDTRLHAHAKGHWRPKANATKDARALAKLLAMQRPNKPIHGPCVVDYLFYVPDRRRRDRANLMQAAKPIIDGVVDAGFIDGDHWEILDIGRVEVAIARHAKLEVRLTFRPVKV